MNYIEYNVPTFRKPVPAFDLGISGAGLNANAAIAGREVRMGTETIHFLKHWGAESAAPNTASSIQGITSDETIVTTALRQMTAGVLGVLLPDAFPGATTTVLIKPDRQSRFDEMAFTLTNFVTVAKEAIPEMRELTLEERKDLKLFFKKTYKKF